MIAHQQVSSIIRNQAKLMSVPESVPEHFTFELSQVGGLTAVMVVKPVGDSRQRAIILVSTSKAMRMEPA